MENQSSTQQQNIYFSPEERNGLYKTIFNRRDVRGQFKPDPVPIPILSRILLAAHHAPSVGFMQPWDFIIVTKPEVKQAVHAGFRKAHDAATEMFQGEKQEVYRTLKLEGILEAPINICITCDRNRTGPVVIGRTADPSMDLYSSVCAVQNLWLAARSEGLGVGWVSIIHQESLRLALGIPTSVVPIAYLCLGYVTHFYEKPELETAGWLPRLPIEDLIHGDLWNNKKGDVCSAVKNGVRETLARVGQDSFFAADLRITSE